MRAAVDIGGTFTDLAYFDAERNEVRFEKALSTPARLCEGVLETLAKGEVPIASVQQLIHGSTVAINAVIQKTGAKTALVTTEGFTDVYEIGRANRPDTYNLFFEKPSPLVPASLRFGIEERVNAAGRVLRRLSRAALSRLVSKLRSAEVEAIAVCLLHSYANPVHEAMLGRILRRSFPGAFVTLSHEVLREYREYERTSTTVLNAYVGREVAQYLGELEEPLSRQNFPGQILVMQSNGGVMTARKARSIPVMMMESGPAGGIIGAAGLGKLLGLADIVAFDMGGTTAKTCLIEGGSPKMTDQYYIGGYGLGYPMRLPAVDIVEVGAGGGSIAQIDEGGGLRVGPRSAGADPGPACYGRGGTWPTVTDANLILGRLSPTQFLGGELNLDLEAACRAMHDKVAKPLGLTVQAAAQGVLRLADAMMSFAVRAITLQRGYDPRRYTMVTFGGAGPLHGMGIARELHIGRVIIPPQPGHFSALGMLLAELRSDLVRTLVTDFDALTAEDIGHHFCELEQEARTGMLKEGVDVPMRTVRALEMRYIGQEYTVAVPVLDHDRLVDIRNAFDLAYEQRYGHSAPAEKSEVVNFRLTLIGAAEKPDFSRLTVRQIAGASAEKTRPVFFEDAGLVECPVYQRAELQRGETIVGPAIVEEYASTTVLHPSDELTIGPVGCLLISTGRLTGNL
jgi:N-methylhydantoinase A